MRLLSLLCLVLLAGCQCFTTCPEVPKPAVVSAMPELCYKRLRSSDPVNVILECYLGDILTLEKAATEREKALNALR